MPGLEFDKLPAGQLEPTDMLKSRYMESQQRMQSDYKRETKYLGEQYLTDREFSEQSARLKQKYATLIDEGNQKTSQELQRIARVTSLMETGQISPEAGQEAIWRMVLPAEAERAMFPTQEKQEGMTPFSPAQISSSALLGGIQDFAEESPDTPGMEWGAPKKTKQGMLNSYHRWREVIGYDAVNPRRQYQLDLRWDSYMMSDKKFDNWWANKNNRSPVPEVKATRATGKFTKALQSRMTGTPIIAGEGMSPLGRSIKSSMPVNPEVAYLQERRRRVEKQPTAQPTAEELYRKGTEEAYDLGKKLRYWD